MCFIILAIFKDYIKENLGIFKDCQTISYYYTKTINNKMKDRNFNL